MPVPGDFGPDGVYGKQQAEAPDTGNPLWDAAILELQAHVESGPPGVILTEVARRMSEDPFAEQPEDKLTLWQTAKRIGVAAARLGYTVVRKAMSFVFNMAKRFIFTIGRFILRGIIMPILSGLAAALASPVGLVALGLIGAGALGYFLWKTFFKGESPEVASGVGAPPVEKESTDVSENMWDRATKEFMDWATMSLASDANTMAAVNMGRREVSAAGPAIAVGAAPPQRGGTEGRRVTEPATSASKERFKWAYREEFRKLGFTDAQISGMLGSIQGESQFDVNAYNPAGGGMGANGVMQWRGARWRRYLAFRKENPQLDEATAQAKFAALEATTDEKGFYDKVRKGSVTPEQAAWAHMNYVERPGAEDRIKSGPVRARYGEAIHKKFLQALDEPTTTGAENTVGGTAPITSKPPAQSQVGQVNPQLQGNAPPVSLKQDTQFLKTKYGPLPVGA